MVITPQQVSELIELIDVYVLRYAATTVTSEYLTDAEKFLLDKYKVPYINKIRSSDDAFRYGMLSLALKGSKHMTYHEVKKRLKNKKFLPMTLEQNVAMESVKLYNYNELKGLGNRMKSTANNIAIEVDKAMRTKYENVLRSEATMSMARKEGHKEMVSRFGKATGDWSRDFDRMSDFIRHKAHTEGRIARQEQQKALGENAWVHVQNTACPSCRKLYLNGDGSPKIFKLSEIKANGSNVGRKKKDWKAVLPPAHPWCLLPETKVLTSEGWKELAEVRGDELVLSVNYKTGTSEWSLINKIIDYEYDGEMHRYTNRSLVHTVTSNHKLPVKFQEGKGYSKEKTDKWNLIASEDLPKWSWKILRTIENWKGVVDPKKVFIGISPAPSSEDYVKFMAWYLSEGCVVLKNKRTGLFEINIAQSREKNPDNYKEIAELMKRLFGKVWEGKMILSITNTNQELYNILKSFGHSKRKFIPSKIKLMSKELIELFVMTYAKGDGHIRSSKGWKNENFSDEIVISTSSERMMSDLSECILKMGNRPSVRLSDEKWTEHHNGRYLGAHVYTIRICRNKYSRIGSIKKEVFHYKGRVMCLELEVNHNFFAMEDGKVTNTGNCYCELHQKLDWEEYNEKTQMFEMQLTPRAKKLQDKAKRIFGDSNMIEAV